MDDLDKQLAELRLITSKELMPNPNNTLGKKIGPAVPPKPKKQQPQVPQSYSLKQQKEPLYAGRLQNNAQNQFYSNIGQDIHNAPTLRVDRMPQETQYTNVQPENSQYSNVMGLLQHSPRPSEVTYTNVYVGGYNYPEGAVYSNYVPPRENNYRNAPNASTATNNVYANGGVDDLPPPPPPIDLNSQYTACTVNINFPPPPDELPPPPSPVSSSYSELRRATQPNQDYNNYMGSQSSSTYESIYEPINPRPPSQMSSRSNYSLYAPYGSGVSTMSGPSQSASRVGQVKEQEVDALTDLLVQGMDNDTEAGDVFGVCAKCNQRVVGANSGCTAMDQIFHTSCFTCHHCAINLQGQPFYSMEGNPYCEDDYLNTLEKCCVCTKPILDRILRATGKPYHPKCFTCVICGKSLDGIPFTVDATNQIHCIEDFHKKFAPRCCVCVQPIMPEAGQEETVRVVALDRSFHIQCYKCEDCGLLLSSEAQGRGCYPLDDHVLCKSCNAKRVQTLTSHMTTEL
ncbi:PREDICTED: thyroid receptor-interacting protein 6 isoform X2 [Nicrophorus vespilloides]|uniref:Thyroid receptor-interacting protein 6 isoform X2 n=1 Tax=Nicrophorus vespilloides TaxID=110193 RepID=A0ABM1MSR5_NICVS|nr:PREDICTED: thyroid receptor-interacting protein 6 isoform X2 [Nicrophorus vespilloides]